MWSGVSGLQAHQTELDVIGNNIANVNTVAFKKSEVIFETLLSQTESIASAATDTMGGTNAEQVGLGVQVGSIKAITTQGELETTGNNTDVAISGNGYFVLAGATSYSYFYTRNGSFNLDSNGNLVSSTGLKVQGWMAEKDAVTGEMTINSSSGSVEDIQIRVGDTIPANETSNIVFSGNLNSENGVAIDPIVVEYTQGGVTRKVQLTFEHCHPTLNYYTYKATWSTNPPNGSEVGDAVIDENTGIQVQGIIELDATGQVIGNYKNTDLATSVSAVRKDSLDQLDDNSSIKLSAVEAIDSAKPQEGMYRIRFEDEDDLTEYTVYYSDDYDYNNPGNATWDAVGTGHTNADQTFGTYNITIKAGEWRGTAVANDVMYFEVAAGNANGVLDLPSEIPTAADDNPLLTADLPVAAANNTGTVALSGVVVNETQAQTATTIPDTASDYTFRNWRVRFTDATNYVVEWANYGNATDPTATSLTAGPVRTAGINGVLSGVTVADSTLAGNWTIVVDNADSTLFTVTDPNGNTATGRTNAEFSALGITIPVANWTTLPDTADAWSFTTADANTWTQIGAGTTATDFVSAAHGLYISSENFTGTATTNDVINFKVSYASSPTYNRDFFTIADTLTQFDANIAAAGANTGTGVLSAVDVAGTAPADAWTITFNADGTYDIVGTKTGLIGNDISTSETFSVQGIEIQSTYWSGTPAAGDVFTFSTSENTVLTDIVVPSGNDEAEALTFVPNTTDEKMNKADAGNPVTAEVKSKSAYQYATSVVTYDSLGAAHTLTYYFERKSTNEWMWSVMDPTPEDANDVQMAGYGLLTFKEDGSYDSSNSVTFESEVGLGMEKRPANLQKVIYDPDVDDGAPQPEEGAGRVEISLDFTKLTQYAASNDGEVYSQDGYGKGTLSSFAVDNNGYVVGLYDNGMSQNIAQIALANFNNPAGLLDVGGSLFRTSGNSGVAQIGVATVGGRGKMVGGSLELSNVDLAEEFTNMIVAQRGFQANSRTITTADQMLQELLSLKR